MIRIYRIMFSPLLSAIFTPLGLGCRFTPTCSEYALEAVQKYGAWRGTVLATRRLCRCHPWGGSGFDPVASNPPPSCGSGTLDLNPNPNRNRFGQLESKMTIRIKIK